MKLSKTGKKAVAIVVGGAIVIGGAFGVPILLKNEVKRFEQEKLNPTVATGETASSETATSESAKGIEIHRGEAYKQLKLEDFTGRYTGINASDVVQLPADYKSIAIPAEYVQEVGDEVNDDLEYIKYTYGELVDPAPDDSGIKRGYAIAFKYKATVDGNTFFLEDGTETDSTVNDYAVGSTVLFDGLDDKLLNHKVGDTINTTIVVANNCYGEDGNELTVYGKEANVTIEILDVKVPTLTDAVIENSFFGYYDKDGNYGTVKTIDDAREYFTERHLNEKKEEYAVSYMYDNSIVQQEAIDEVADRVFAYYTEFYKITAEGEGYDSVDDYAVAGGYQNLQEILDSEMEYVKEQSKKELIWQAVSEQNDLANNEEFTDWYIREYLKCNDYESLMLNYGYKENEGILASQDAEIVEQKRTQEATGWNLAYGYHVALNDRAVKFIVDGMKVGQ